MTEPIIFIFGIFISVIFFTAVWVYLRLLTEAVSKDAIEHVNKSTNEPSPNFQLVNSDFKQDHFKNNTVRQ